MTYLIGEFATSCHLVGRDRHPGLVKNCSWYRQKRLRQRLRGTSSGKI